MASSLSPASDQSVYGTPHSVGGPAVASSFHAAHQVPKPQSQQKKPLSLDKLLDRELTVVIQETEKALGDAGGNGDAILDKINGASEKIWLAYANDNPALKTVLNTRDVVRIRAELRTYFN